MACPSNEFLQVNFRDGANGVELIDGSEWSLKL